MQNARYIVNILLIYLLGFISSSIKQRCGDIDVTAYLTERKKKVGPVERVAK